MDLHSECENQYTDDADCDRCRETAINMCAAYSTDKYCKPGDCP